MIHYENNNHLKAFVIGIQLLTLAESGRHSISLSWLLTKANVSTAASGLEELEACSWLPVADTDFKVRRLVGFFSWELSSLARAANPAVVPASLEACRLGFCASEGQVEITSHVSTPHFICYATLTIFIHLLSPSHLVLPQRSPLYPPSTSGQGRLAWIWNLSPSSRRISS